MKALNKITSPILLEHDKIAELLIQSGADVDVVGAYGGTALTWAATKGMYSLDLYDLYIHEITCIFQHLPD